MAVSPDPAADPDPVRPTLVPGGIADHASCLLTRVGQAVFRLQERALQPLGVHVRHFSVLQGLADLGPTGQLDLGRYLRIDPATMATALEQLESRGAVARERDPHDRRRYVVALTREGTDLLARMLEAIVGVERVLEADLGSSGLDGLREALDALAGGEALHGALADD